VTLCAAGPRDRAIRSSDPTDRAVSVGRVRRPRPTAESKAASSRRTPGRGPRTARAIQSPLSSIEAEKMTLRDAVCGRVAGSSDPISWIVRFLRAASGGRGLRQRRCVGEPQTGAASPQPGRALGARTEPQAPNFEPRSPNPKPRCPLIGNEARASSLEPRSRLRISITITNYEHELRARQASYS